MRGRILVVGLVVGLAAVVCCIGCGSSSNSSASAWEHPEHQFVVDTIDLPVSSQVAQANGFDLNGDGAVDNRLGDILTALAGATSGAGAQESMDATMAEGGMIVLFGVYAETLDDSSSSNVWLFLGQDETLTNGPQAGATFTVDTAGPQMAYLSGAIDQGFGTYGGDTATLGLKIPLSQGVPVELTLQQARVEFDVAADGTITGGRLGGVVAETDLDSEVLPAAVANLDAALAANCADRGGTGGTGTCGCIEGSGTATIQAIFDTDGDCVVTLAEIEGNSLIQNLLAGDVDLGGGQMGMSLGVGFHAVPAVFQHASPPSS